MGTGLFVQLINSRLTRDKNVQSSYKWSDQCVFMYLAMALTFSLIFVLLNILIVNKQADMCPSTILKLTTNITCL